MLITKPIKTMHKIKSSLDLISLLQVQWVGFMELYDWGWLILNIIHIKCHSSCVHGTQMKASSIIHQK